MGKRNRMPGLIKRNKIWWIDKKIDGQRVQESTGSTDLDEAQRYLIHKLEGLRQAKVYGIRPKWTFAQAAAKYLKEKQKRSIADDIGHLDALMPYIGELPLESIHMGTLATYMKERQNGQYVERMQASLGAKRFKKVVTNQTVNHALKVVRHILRLAAGKWRDENGLTWLGAAPMIELLDETVEKRKAIPISWKEQDRLFSQLSPALQRMATFAVNTGCRNNEVCSLRWEWEIPVPSLNTSVFVIPATNHKNKRERLIVLNDMAKRVIEEVRGAHPTYVFTYKDKPYYSMHSSSWRKGRIRAGLPHVRVHDLKHTFGARLTNAGISLEHKKQLLGHIGSVDITTHYSLAGIQRLIEYANTVCIRRDDISVASFLKQLNANARKSVRDASLTCHAKIAQSRISVE
jgi:integrase